jgi:hypothetical protein
MTPRAYFRLISCLALLVCSSVAATAQQPRLAEADVAAIADAKAREEGYPLETYSHSAPMYVQTSGAWEVHYFARQEQHDRTGKFSIAVDDASRFASLSPSYSAPTVSASPAVASSATGFSWVRAVLIGIAVALTLRVIGWLRRRTSHARSNAKA